VAKVILMHFDAQKDGIYHAKIGEPVMRVAREAGISLQDCSDPKDCLVEVQHISDEEPTSYMEDEELDILVALGAITQAEANECQQYTISPKIRVASMMLVKGDVLIKPYSLK
jgi:hypothetical protein